MDKNLTFLLLQAIETIGILNNKINMIYEYQTRVNDSLIKLNGELLDTMKDMAAKVDKYENNT